MKLDLGTMWALCDAQEQADFINTAGRHLKRACETGNRPNQTEVQCMYIVDLLDPSGRELIKSLANWIRLDEETPRVVRRVVYEDTLQQRHTTDGEEE